MLFLEKNRIMKIVRNLSRIFVGLVFIFSGFVKAVDPWGTAYKNNDYLIAMGLESLLPLAFTLAVIMIAAEFIVGFALLLNVKTKFAAWGALLFMLFFTPLTLWLAIANPVSDCGCFGDAIKMTNWQTFFKNLIILVPTIIVFVQRKKFNNLLSCSLQWIIAGIGFVFVSGVMWYSYRHLPIIDFLPYKEGNYLPALMEIPPDAPKDEYAHFITLEDTTTGQKIEIDVNVYTNDSTYWGTGTKYKYVSMTEPRLIKKGYEPPIHDFNIFDKDNNNYIDTALQYNGYVFLFTSPKVEKACTKNLDKISALYHWSVKNNHKFFALSASNSQEIDTFIVRNNLPFTFYMCDETTLKTMVRSNPGLMLLKKGTVIKKWSYVDFPDIQNIQSIINKNK